MQVSAVCDVDFTPAICFKSIIFERRIGLQIWTWLVANLCVSGLLKVDIFREIDMFYVCNTYHLSRNKVVQVAAFAFVHASYWVLDLTLIKDMHSYETNF